MYLAKTALTHYIPSASPTIGVERLLLSSVCPSIRSSVNTYSSWVTRNLFS